MKFQVGDLVKIIEKNKEGIIINCYTFPNSYRVDYNNRTYDEHEIKLIKSKSDIDSDNKLKIKIKNEYVPIILREEEQINFIIFDRYFKNKIVLNLFEIDNKRFISKKSLDELSETLMNPNLKTYELELILENSEILKLIYNLMRDRINNTISVLSEIEKDFNNLNDFIKIKSEYKQIVNNDGDIIYIINIDNYDLSLLKKNKSFFEINISSPLDIKKLLTNDIPFAVSTELIDKQDKLIED